MREKILIGNNLIIFGNSLIYKVQNLIMRGYLNGKNLNGKWPLKKQLGNNTGNDRNVTITEIGIDT